jgi:D-tyrosyl-tRNA(Tyr) deacylase
MRAVVQRVSSAKVEVDEVVVGEMGPGLLALVGVGAEDDAATANQLADKLVNLRVFEDEDARMNRSLLDTGGTLGVVSQFTLFGDCRRGRRPSFGEAAEPDLAAPLIEAVIAAARALGVTVITGRFQTMMNVSLCNDGPVTLLLDTEKRF